MKILDDLDSFYTNAMQFIFGYVIGYGISIILTIGLLWAFFYFGSPIPKRISEAPRSTLQDPFIFKDGIMYPKPATR